MKIGPAEIRFGAWHNERYNFARVHQTLRVTPAMEAGIADHAWNIDEMIGLLGV